MANIRASVSSIDKLKEDEKLLEELEENEYLFVQCHSIVDGLFQSDKATSCSTRSSITMSSGAASPFPAYECASSAESSDDEEKVKEPDSEDEDIGTTDHIAIIEENTRPAIVFEGQNTCPEIKEQNIEKNSFSQFFCRLATCLKYLSVVLFFNGVFLAFGSWSLKQITQAETWKDVEGLIPTYVSCLTMLTCGFFGFTTKFFQRKRQYKKLIWFVLFLSLFCAAFCIFSLIYLITVIHTNLNQLNACVFNNVEQICSCYSPNKKLIKFAENLGCSAVKDKLKELAYAVSCLFGIGCLISIATAVSAFFLLCRERRERKLKRASRKKLLQIDEAIQNTNIALNDQNNEESTFSTHHHSNHAKQQRTIQLAMPSRVKKMSVKERRALKLKETEKVSSVATQTPSFMMHIYDDIEPDQHSLISDEDRCSELSLEMKNHLPPSYNEAVQRNQADQKESVAWENHMIVAMANI